MWYVVQTTSGREKIAVEKCRNALSREAACRIFAPTCELEKVWRGQRNKEIVIAFPGYVFIESDTPKDLKDQLQNISSVVTPVCIGGGFYPIRADEEAVLRRMMDENDCIRFSVGYLVDQVLIVKEGPLQGFTEAVRWIDRHKRAALVEISLFNELRKMKVGLEVKAKLTAEEYQQMMQSA